MRPAQRVFIARSFNTASGMDCMQCKRADYIAPGKAFQYRKRYGLHAIDAGQVIAAQGLAFQYRKRYGLHAIVGTGRGSYEPVQVSIPQAVRIACNEDVEVVEGVNVSIPQAVRIACNSKIPLQPRRTSWFQYRKRYGLHAIKTTQRSRRAVRFQYRKRYGLHAICFSRVRFASF